jgi:hypothetical protein
VGDIVSESPGDFKSVHPGDFVGIRTLIERDLYFRPAYSLSVYAEAARRAGRITESPIDLSAAKGGAR